MSNLLKQYYVQNVGAGTRIINSDDRLRAQMKQNVIHVNQEADESDKEKAEFSEGLEVQSADAGADIDAEAIRAEALEAARAEAERIKAEAKAEAEKYLKDAKQEALGLLAENKQLGYEQGLADAKEEYKQKSDALEEDLRVQKQELYDNYEKKLTGMEGDIVDAIISVFDKVFNIQFEDKREILMALVTNTLMDVDAGDRIRIHSSDADIPLFEEHMPNIQDRVGAEVNIELVRDIELIEGQCQIETPFGVFDCGVDTELSGLIKDIRSLA